MHLLSALLYTIASSHNATTLHPTTTLATTALVAAHATAT